MPRVLVAGIGNIFLGDDGFGVEVARRLSALPLPDGRWRDVFTGAVHKAGAPLVSELVNRFPVALLVPDGTSLR